MNNIVPIAQYGNTMIPSSELANIRGYGKFNPPPVNKSSYTTLEYSTNTNAVSVYGENSAGYNVNINNRDSVSTPYIQSPTIQPTQLPSVDKFQSWAMKATNQQPTELLLYFFSLDNVNYIQNRIIEEVQRIKGARVARQSDDELLVIMRNKYLYAISGFFNGNPCGISTMNGHYVNNGLEQQLIAMNKSVLDECIQQVVAGIDMYKKYYTDASTIPEPMFRPVIASNKGSNVLQPNLGFEDNRQKNEDVRNYNERYNVIN